MLPKIILGLLFLSPFWVCAQDNEVPQGSKVCPGCDHNRWWDPDRDFHQAEWEDLLLHLGWPKDMEFSSTQGPAPLEGQEMLHFQQEHLGIPIYQARISALLDQDIFQFLHGRYIPPSILPDTNNIIPRKLAVPFALSQIKGLHYAWENPYWEKDLKESQEDPGATYYPSARLLFAPKKADYQEFSLVYQMEVRSIDPDDNYELWLDAHTGKILRQFSQSAFCDPAQAQVETHYYGEQNLNIRQREGWLDDYVLQSCGPNQIEARAYELNSFGEGKSWGRLPKLTHSSSNWGEHHQDATTAYWALQEAIEFFAEASDWIGPGQEGEEIRLLVDWKEADGSPAENARYLVSKDIHQIFIGNINGKSLATLDVLGHEYAHAFIRRHAGLINERQPGAINEGLADILAVMLERSVLFAQGSWDWTLGEEAKPLRSLSDPAVFGMPVFAGNKDPYWFDDSYENCPLPSSGNSPTSNDNCGIHQNSSIVSHWFYILTQGGPGGLVRPISVEDATEIVLQTIRYYLLSTSDFNDLRKGSIRAAEDLFGFCSHQAAQLKNAWSLVGIGQPNTSECIHILGNPDLCLNDRDRKYLFEAVGPFNANFSWTGIPEDWSYKLQGERKQFLTLQYLPENFETAEIRVVAQWQEKTDTTYLILNPVTCTQKALRQPDPIPDFEEVRIYPNPAVQKLTLFLPEAAFPASIQIFDAQGKKVADQVSNASLSRYDLSLWKPGIYFIRLRSNKVAWEGKFIKL